MSNLPLFQQFLLLVGSAFIFIAGIGIVSFPNTLWRAHALSKAGTLGSSCILLALLLIIGTYTSSIKILMAICFNFITIPLAGHIFTRYAIEEMDEQKNHEG